jgi:hypothetical protein
MSSNIKRNIHTISKLRTKSKKKRCELIEGSKLELVKALSEIIHNVLSGNVKLSADQHRRLRKHNRCMFDICNTKALKKKKALLIQKGGFLPALIPPALAVLAGIIGDYVRS